MTVWIIRLVAFGILAGFGLSMMGCNTMPFPYYMPRDVSERVRN